MVSQRFSLSKKAYAFSDKLSCCILKVVIQMRLRIKELREDADIKQREIAAFLNCDQSLYSKYEREVRPLPLDVAVKLAQYYKVSVDYLLGLADKR